MGDISSSSPCEDFSESWHFSHWERTDCDLRSSNLSASVCSSDSLCIDEDDIEEPVNVIEKKRKSLCNVLRVDEDLFQTSLNSVNISKRNTRDLSLTMAKGSSSPRTHITNSRTLICPL